MLNFLKNDFKDIYSSYSKDQYLDKLKKSLKEDDLKSDKVAGEKYYEWEIKDWNKLKFLEYSSQFSVGGHKWKIKLYPDGNDDIREGDYVSVGLENVDIVKENHDLSHIYVNFVITMRNFNDYSCFSSGESTLFYFTKHDNSKDYSRFIHKPDLYKKKKGSDKSLIENDKVIIGAYVRVYKYNKEQYIEELKNIIKNDNINKNEIIGEDYFEWEVKNWDKLIHFSCGPNMSPVFTVGGFRWGIKLFFFGKCKTNEEHFYIYLSNLDDNEKNCEDICTQFVLTFRNNKDFSCYKSISSSLYCLNKINKGVNSIYIDQNDYKNYIKPLIKDSKIIIGGYIRIYNNFRLVEYFDELKKLLKENCIEDDEEIIKKGYYEWEIKDFDNIINNKNGLKFNSKFTVCDKKWNLCMESFPNVEEKDSNFLKIYMNNIDNNEEIDTKENENYCTKYILVFRYYRDFFCYKTILSDECCYGKNMDGYYPNYINKIYYNKKIKPLIKNNKIIFGVFVCIYKNDSFGHYLGELKKSINNDENVHEIIENKYYEWEIKDWDKITNQKYSPKFFTNKNKWRISLYKNDNKNNVLDYISIYLKNTNILKEFNSHLYTRFVLSVRNYKDFYSYKTEVLPSPTYFNKKKNRIGFSKFINKENLNNKLENSHKPLIEDNKIIIGVYIQIYKYKMEQYLDELKYYIINNNWLSNKNIMEDYHEWKVKDLRKNSDVICSSEFMASGHKWKFRLYPYGDDLVKGKGYISIYLDNVDVSNEKFAHIYAHYSLFIHNFDDCSCYYRNKKPTFYYLNKKENLLDWQKYMNKSNVYINNKKSNKSLIENNDTIIGTYIRVYQYDKDKYINELKDLIKDHEAIYYEIFGEDYYEWNIESWSKFENEQYSPEFVIGGHKWKLKLYPNGQNDNNYEYASIYLENQDVQNENTLHICANVVFSIRNYNDYSFFSENEETSLKFFSKDKPLWGLNQFVKKSDLYNKCEKFNKSLIEDDKAIITVYIRVYKYKIDHYINELNHYITEEDVVKDEIIEEDYYEWEIENLNNQQNLMYSPEFIIGGYKWNLKVYPKGDDEVHEDGYITVYLNNLDIQNKTFTHFYTHHALYIRNLNDYSFFSRERKPSIVYSNNKNIGSNIQQVKNKSNFYIKNDTSYKPLVENGKTVFGTYIRVFKYNREKYINEIKNLIKDNDMDNYNVIGEDYREWRVDDWDLLENIEHSPGFEAVGYNWKIKLNLNDHENIGNNYISLYLENTDIFFENSLHICAKVVFAIRNYNDYSYFEGKVNPSIYYYSRDKNIWGLDHYIRKSDLYLKSEESGKPLVESDKTVIGVYIRVYEYKMEQYINELKYLIKNENNTINKVIDEDYYEWKISNWNELEHLEWSPLFTVGNHRWKIKLWPNGYGRKGKNVSMYLVNEDMLKFNSDHICCKFILSLRNYNEYSYYTSYVSLLNYFSKYKKEYGNREFVNKKELFLINGKSNKSLIEDNKVIIGAYIQIYQYNKKDQYIDELKYFIKDNSAKTNKIIGEDYYEWTIDEWNKRKNIEYSPEFIAGGYKWKILLYENDNDNDNKDNNISIWLINSDIKNEDSLHICANFVFSIRNYNSYCCFIAKDDTTLNYFSKNRNIWGWNKFIKKSELNIKNKESNKSFVENNKVVIGTYIRVYQYKIVQFVEELKFLLKDDNIKNEEIIGEDYYEWKIKDWNSLEKINYSPEFTIGGHKWKIKLYPNGKDLNNTNEYISVFLENEEKTPHIFVNCVLCCCNYNDYSCSTTYVSYFNYFNESKKDFGKSEFISKTECHTKCKKTNKSLIEDNQLILGAYIRVYKNENLENYINNLKELLKMDNEKDYETIGEGYYEWTIKDWEKLDNPEYSPLFMINDYKWRIKLYPNGNDKVKEKEYVSVFLENLDTTKYALPNIFANFVISFRNYNDYSGYTAHKVTSLFYFSKGINSLGFRHFIKRTDLYAINEQTNKPLVENKKVIVSVYLKIYNNIKDEMSLINKQHYILLNKKLLPELPVKEQNNISLSLSNLTTHTLNTFNTLNNNNNNNNNKVLVNEFPYPPMISPDSNGQPVYARSTMDISTHKDIDGQSPLSEETPTFNYDDFDD
ncbi:hypothetical protein BCR32DRAFT_295511 [Anaeromyces robustus]|uniref:MATH domain-containing protein n=1 Tax=Anaeromyces robustus TaxID=1754192 RepID=A0A1Y1WVQ8_9FUNG|nr:hypothetical protein BCR32DRAFT_295511 [Anaeromyces robustus]|eukprot:ORX77620.1 hypothetical protein BCR32DRAFT_295511 [Anaeromyces robustus]